MYFVDNYYPLFTCPHQERVGGIGDGPKWVCDPLRLKHVSRQPRRFGDGGGVGEVALREDKCLIYSIGSNGDFSFEDALVNMLGAGTCEIHVFDMSRDYTRPNDATNKDIHFHHWGLSSSYSSVGKNDKDTFMTLQESLQKLGHVNRTIDIFKIDCETCTSVL
jgi:hypothetical protein